MKLRIDKPDDNKVKDLAPRVECLLGPRVYEWGYALCLTSGGQSGQVRVLWDEDGEVEDVDAEILLFKGL